MTRCLAGLLLAGLATALTPLPSLAQQDGPADSSDKMQAFHHGGERTQSIDFLFGALKAAPDDASATAAENRIWAMWTNAANDTPGLLMSRAKKAIDDDDYDLALRLLDA